MPPSKRVDSLLVQKTKQSMCVQDTMKSSSSPSSSSCCIWRQQLRFGYAMSHVFGCCSQMPSLPTACPRRQKYLKEKQKNQLLLLQQQQQQHEQQRQCLRHHQFNAQYLLLLLLCVLLVHPICGWPENIQPKIRIPSLNHNDVQRFSSGNNSLKLLDQDGDSILIGGRNVMYNISLSSLTENKVSPARTFCEPGCAFFFFLFSSFLSLPG